MRLQFEGDHARRRLMIFGAVAAVAIVAAACTPPKPAPAPVGAPVTTKPKPPPPPPPPPTTTAPPSSICGASASSAGVTAAEAPDDDHPNGNRYAAVVEHNGRSKVLQREVSSPAEIAQFRVEVAAQGEVLSFAPDGEVHALAEIPTWGFLDAKFSAAWSVPTATTGSGVRIAELDTGIDTTHEDLTGHFDATPGADIVGAADKNNPPPDTTDPSTSGHGTHVAGIIAATAGNGIGVEGGAPGVTLVPVRVLNSSGAGSYADVAAGILWAADVTKGNAQVITMSLGGGTSSPTVDAAVQTIEDLTNANYTHPVITIAAGNSSCSNPEYPASLASTTPQVLAVSALCKSGVTTFCPTATPWPADGAFKLATYSSLAWNGSGAAKGITAPGTDINSSLPGVGTYGTKSGTSMATPFVAAAAALVIAHCPSDTAAQVVARLGSSARDLGPSGPDKLYGFGMLDADNAVKGC